jgi:hypothetical protein
MSIAGTRSTQQEQGWQSQQRWSRCMGRATLHSGSNLCRIRRRVLTGAQLGGLLSKLGPVG